MPTHTSQPRTETNIAGQVAYRGVVKRFEWGFFSDDEQTVPIIPGNANAYPRVQILDPDGEVYLTATPPKVHGSPTTGFWVYDFTVPTDAELTGVDTYWTFAAEIINAAGRHAVYRTTFEVRDPVVVKATNSERFYAVISGHGVRVLYRSAVQLYDLSLDILLSGSTDTYLIESATCGSGPYDVREVVGEDGIYAYYIDIPAQRVIGFTQRALSTATWQVHWTIQESATDARELVYQILEVLPNTYLPYVPDVRFVIDKLEKRQQSKQAYKDGDVLAAIRNGLRAVNSVFPYSGWTLGTVPDPLKLYVTLGAAYFAYVGQLGLAVDLQFNFSGQTTVLDQDQTGGIESMLERFRSALWEQLKEVKTDVLRHQRPVGVVATRPTRARHLYNTVFRVSSGSSANMVSFLNSIGLI